MNDEWRKGMQLDDDELEALINPPKPHKSIFPVFAVCILVWAGLIWWCWK